MRMAVRRGPASARGLLLQHPPAASGVGRPGAHGGVARWHERHSRREGCGHDASLGQRGRLAHMPTAATAAGLRGLIFGEVGDGSASNYKTARRGPTHGVHFSGPRQSHRTTRDWGTRAAAGYRTRLRAKAVSAWAASGAL